MHEVAVQDIKHEIDYSGEDNNLRDSESSGMTRTMSYKSQLTQRRKSTDQSFVEILVKPRYSLSGPSGLPVED